MPRPRDKWNRLYSELPDDVKVQRIADVTGRSWPEVNSTWVVLMCLANKATYPYRGWLMFGPGEPYTFPELARAARIEVDALKAIIGEMVKLRMLAWEGDCLYLVNFSKRNPDSDLAADRKAAQRERDRETEQPSPSEEVGPEVDVTGQHWDNEHHSHNVVPSSSHGDDYGSGTMPLIGEGESEGEGPGPPGRAPKRPRNGNGNGPHQPLLAGGVTVDDVYREYEENIESIVPTLRKLLDELMASFSTLWVKEAIAEAVKRGVRKYVYVASVCVLSHNRGLDPRRSLSKQKGRRGSRGETPIDVEEYRHGEYADLFGDEASTN